MKKKKFILLAGLCLFAVLAAGQNFWQAVPMPATGEGIYAIRVDNNGLLVLCRSSDVFCTQDLGVTWAEATNWGGYSSRCIGFNSQHHIFIGTAFNGIFRSTDNGATFTGISNGLTTQSVWCFDLLTGDVILAGTDDGIFRSTDNGDNWTHFGTGYPSTSIKFLSTGFGGTLFAATDTLGVFRSTDSGNTWTLCPNLPAGNFLLSMAASNMDSIVFTALSPDGLYRSMDNGNTWSALNNGLPPKRSFLAPGMASMSFVDMFGWALLVAAYGHSVYKGQIDQDPDQSMSELGPGLPPSPHVTTRTITPQGKIIVGCQSQGLYQGNLGTPVPIIPGENDNCRLWNSPNPAIGRTTVFFTLPCQRKVTITASDILGRKLETLFHAPCTPGSHSIPWTTGLLPGCYLLTLDAGDLHAVGKVVIQNR
ncbi:MAG: hypothetical protein NTX61_15440 [Bacteroidetes bacterium]|nr:hypothetical protein [Bacteroidota bacterium]